MRYLGRAVTGATKLTLAVAIGGMMIGPTNAETAPRVSPAGLFKELLGKCWKADIGQGQTDTRCFSAAIGEQLALDLHKVRDASGAVVYQGVTVYRQPAGDAPIGYSYYNSAGDLFGGTVERCDNTVKFASNPPLAAADALWTIYPDGFEKAATTTTPKLRFTSANDTARGL